MPHSRRGTRALPSGRLGAVLAAALVGLAVAVAGGHTLLSPTGSAGGAAGAANASDGADDEDLTCTGTGGLNLTHCRAVRLPSGQTVRYAVLPADSATPRAALVDLGGPGVSLFGAHWPANLRDAVPEGLRGLNLVLIEEPWVSLDYPDPCRGTVRDYYRDVRRGTPNPAAAVWRDCDLAGHRWGWSAHYRAAVDAIAGSESLTIEALVGASFAGRRLAYLGPAAPGTVLLVDPAPPGRFDGARYLDERHGAALRHLATHGCRCPELAPVVEALSTAAQSLDRQPVEVPGRSLPVSGADVGAAAVALAYQPVDVIAAAWQALLDPRQGADLIGKLADLAWMRFGVDDVSPAWLAYLDEVCAGFDGWPAAPGAGDAAVDPVRSFLRAYHAPCAHAQRSATDPAPAPPAGDVCIVTGDDGVTTPAFLEPWREFRNVRIVTGGGSLHGDLAATSRCAG